MIRKADIVDLNAAINDPSVLPHFLPEGCPPDLEVDLSNYYDKLGNLAFTDGAAVMLFPWMEGAAYEVHFMFPKPVRGKAAVEAASEMIDRVFTEHGARVIYGYPPRDNRAVRTLGYRLGFRPIGQTVTDSMGRECPIYTLECERWA